MNSRLFVILSGLFLVVLAWIGLLSANDITLYCPKPMIVVTAYWMLSLLHLQYAAVSVPTILFFLWNPGLFVWQQATLPKRTVGLAALLSLLTIAEFETVWSGAIKYQGAQYTITIFTVNMLCLAVLWWTVIRAWRRPSFAANLLSHWILFAWIAWYAFPFLGAPIDF